MSLDVAKSLTIVEAGRLNSQSIVVAFSDGTSASYTVEQLATLTSERKATEPQRSQAVNRSTAFASRSEHAEPPECAAPEVKWYLPVICVDHPALEETSADLIESSFKVIGNETNRRAIDRCAIALTAKNRTLLLLLLRFSVTSCSRPVAFLCCSNARFSCDAYGKALCRRLRSFDGRLVARPLWPAASLPGSAGLQNSAE